MLNKFKIFLKIYLSSLGSVENTMFNKKHELFTKIKYFDMIYLCLRQGKKRKTTKVQIK